MPRDEREIRLAKLMARRGIASRRASESLIEEGRVTVDGEVVHRIALPDHDWHTGCRDVQPMRSGDLLVIGDYATMRISWEGEVRWLRKEWEQPPIELHHELFASDDGRIWALGHDIRTRIVKTRNPAGEPVPYFHDLLVELDEGYGQAVLGHPKAG